MSPRFLVFFTCILCLSVQIEGQLEVGFYQSSCEGAEFIIKDEVSKAFNVDNGVAPGLLRLHFHDCFVRGCDGSVLINSTSSNIAEKDSPANNPSLRGFDTVDKIKNRLETVCKGVVSCADILAFAARDSIELAGGYGYDVPAGRRDGRVSLASETIDLPFPTFNVNQLTQSFAKKGLTQEEMVILSGGHTIGRAHCTSITNRLYNFNASTSQDPSLDPNYATQLKQKCPKNSNPNLVVPMKPSSPNTVDAGYYLDILAHRGLFTSDQTLLSNSATANQVKQYANNIYLWEWKFAAAMVKMGQIGVLTGNAGEIRLKCGVINR